MHWWQALITVILAGIAESIGQSVVLFVNKVRPARFILSLAINALLIAFGYIFIVLATWLTFLIPGSPRLPLEGVGIAVAISYAPLLGAFLGALPYAGNAVLLALRIWQLVAMVTAVAALGHLLFWISAGHVAIGWLVMLVAQQTLGKPIAQRIQSAAAGVHIVGEKVAVRRVADQLTRTSTPVRDVADLPISRKRSRGAAIFAGIILTFLCVIAIVLVLTPLRPAIAGPYLSGAFWRVGLNLLWMVLVAVVIAAFLAPLETLGWWAGWYGDDIDAAHPQAKRAGGARAAEPSRYVVYLDGISQSSSQYTPDIETFLDALEPELPANVQLVRGIMAYSVVNRPLDDDPIYARFWKLVEGLRSEAKTAILGMVINIRNVMIVAVSADQRYGPLYNLGIAQVVYNALIQCGYRIGSAIPITMIGYSGGGQMCVESAPLLSQAFRTRLEVISLGGVMTGTAPFTQFDHLYHFHGTKDVIEPVGRVMFSSRWRIAVRSSWNRALRRGKITISSLGPVRHQVPGGMLDPNYKLPDGRTALRHTLDKINEVLTSKATASS